MATKLLTLQGVPRRAGFGSLTVVMRVPAAVRAELTNKGHQIELRGDFAASVGGGQAVLRDFASGINFGASDPRKDGGAIPQR